MRVAITGFVASFPWLWGKARLVPESSLKDIEVFPVEGIGDAFSAGTRLLDGLEIAPQRLAVISGSSKGDLHALSQWADHKQLNWTPDFPNSQLRSGVFLSPNAACATGAHVLSLGARFIQNGQADVAFCEAVELPQHPMVLAAYRNMGALSKAGIMRPFDARRDGFLPNWGVGSLLLESEEHAQGRGAKIHGFLSGASMQCDATHMTSMCPDGDSIARAIRGALQKAGNPPIDYINAHGTATKHNDLIETRAIKAVFGTNVPVSSTKPLTGHLLGASGAVEAVICLLAMKENFAPPTLNLEEVDDEMNLDFVALEGRNLEMNAVLSLSYGFGGHIGALIFEKN